MKTIFAVAVVAMLPLVAGARQVRTVKIEVGRSFEPAVVKVVRGAPVRIEFVRNEEPTCATSVVMTELNQEKPLAEGRPAVFEFTPSQTGELHFACGMKMLKGKLVVK